MLEYAGGELFNYIVANGRMHEAQARRFFQQIISGVDYAHKCKIVHRDLKPENVFVNAKGELRLGDFGLSRPIGFPDKRYGNEVRSPVAFNYDAHNI